MEKWRNKSPHDINIVVAKEKIEIKHTFDDHHIDIDGLASQSSQELWKDPQKLTSSSVERKQILSDRHKLWGAQSLPSGGMHETNKHTFVQGSAKYGLIIGVYRNMESHIGGKAERSQVNLIEGNNKTNWRGHRINSPLLYKN